MREGARVALPLFPAVFVLGASFGVLAGAADVGALAAVVMSATTFAGSAQIAAVGVLGAGGSVAAAVVSALLLNVRYAPIGISVAHGFHGPVARRFAQAQLVVDESWALSRGRVPVLLGIGTVLWFGWVGGTAVGALAGEAIDDTAALGLDGAFAALFLALLVAQLGDGGRVRVAIAGAAIAAVLVPLAPPGVPIIAATAATTLGWSRR